MESSESPKPPKPLSPIENLIQFTSGYDHQLKTLDETISEYQQYMQDLKYVFDLKCSGNTSDVPANEMSLRLYSLFKDFFGDGDKSGQPFVQSIVQVSRIAQKLNETANQIKRFNNNKKTLAAALELANKIIVEISNGCTKSSIKISGSTINTKAIDILGISIETTDSGPQINLSPFLK